jgi:hypothetical protein
LLRVDSQFKVGKRDMAGHSGPLFGPLFCGFYCNSGPGCFASPVAVVS